MTQQTSINAYNLKILPHIGSDELEVLSNMRARPNWTDRELKDYMGWEINAITGRRNGLFKKGLVRVSEKRLCRVTGNKVLAWEVVPEKVEQRNLFF